MTEGATCVASECSPSVEEQISTRDTSSASQTTATVRLKLRHPKSKKKVIWSNETVDNEHMNRKKSKCCCIYEKPHAFGESSTDTDDECDHCRGHVEVKKKTVDQP